VTSLKEQLVASNHAQTPAIEKRYNDVIGRLVSPYAVKAYVY